jgi:hypothetical protein
MADKLNRLAPTGNLDTDSDVRYVGRGEGKTGDTTQNRNTQIAGDEGSTSGDITPTLGNVFGFDLGSVQAQDKIYRVTVDGDVNKSHSLSFLSTNRDGRIGTGTGPNGEVEFNGTVASLVAAVQAAGITAVMSVTQSGNEVNFRMTAYPHYQWYLESVGTDDVSVICTQEAIPVDLAGPLKDIGSYDLLGDLFVFSTTQDNEPTELNLVVTAIGPITAGVYTGPLTFLTFSQPHGLVAGQWIRITNSQAPWLNGLFVVRQINSATEIGIPTVLAWGGTRPLVTSFTEVIRINPTGIGEIGVAQKDDNSDSWTYIRLLRSVELNFVSKWAMRCDARKKGGDAIPYYTDKYNLPRSFRYNTESYTTDGALRFNNPNGYYSFGQIANQSSLVNNSSAGRNTRILYLGESDGGGNLVGGNKYYVFRFKDAEDEVTKWSEPTRAVSVFPKSQVDDIPLYIKGTLPSDQPTTKSVNLSLVDIPAGVYKSVDLAAIESSSSGSLSGTLFVNIELSEQDTTLNFSHTGNEDGQVTLDVGELPLSINDFLSIKTVGDLSIIDKRLVLGNITYADINNLGDWGAQFKHQLKYKEIEGTNYLVVEKLGGYMKPENVFNYPSVVLNETYRVGFDVIFNDGSISPTFRVDDIKIDTSPTNVANPTDNRRVPNGGLPDYGLNTPSQSINPSIKVPHIVFSNIDMNFNLGGVPIGSLISTIRFRFAVVKPEVLASGYVIMGVSGGKTIGPVKIDPPFIINQTIKGDDDHHFQYLEWAGDYKLGSSFSGGAVDAGWGNIRYNYPNAYDPQRRTAFFYSPDITMGKLDEYQVQAADRINIMYPTKLKEIRTGTPNVDFNQNRQMGSTNFGGSGDAMLPSAYVEMIASPGAAFVNILQNSNGVNQYDITDAKIMEAGESEIIAGQDVDTYNKENSQIGQGITSSSITGGLLGAGITGLAIGGDPMLSFVGGIIGNILNSPSGADVGQAGTGRFQYDSFETAHSKCLAIRTSQDMFPYSNAYWQSNNADYGVYYAQLFRDVGLNKYGDNETTEYQPYSQSYSAVDIKTIQAEVEVFGGDAFIVKTLFRNRFAKVDQEDDPLFTQPAQLHGVLSVGRHLGVLYTTQTTMNMELVGVPDPLTAISYPESFSEPSNDSKLRKWIDYTGGEYLQFYNESYSYGLKSLIREAYSRELDDSIRDVPTRILYSTRDIYSSKEDSMRVFQPASLHDLDGTWGPIEVVSNVNGELFTVQPRKYQLQYFNARGTLETSSSSVEVLIGDGSVLSRDGQTLSSYGTQHKWSCIKGLNDNGKDVLYWFNAENGLMMRFGEDGTRVISARGMTAFFANYTKWVKGKHQPAFEQGVRGVWDDRRKEAIWTFTGWRDIKQAWQSGTLVEVGEVVTNTNAPSDTYENFPRFFRCTVVHQSSSSTEPGVGVDWEDFWTAIAYTDKSYYSIFTICFNEMTNGFRCFYGHLPKTYLRWQNTFLSSHPVHRNLIFEHRLGEPTTWYGVNTFLTGNIAPKVEDAYFEMVINDIPEQSFGGVAVDALTENAPDRVEYRTARQYTFDNAVDFEQRDDQFYSPIKNDATLTNNPDSDGEYLRGDFLKVKVFIFGGTYNLFHSIVVKIRETLRRTNT